MLRYVAIITLGLVFAPVAPAQTLSLESPIAQVALLELYTSEGCSSCPPADRWVSGLKGDRRLWREVVPVAFHVDYWDYIGWPDRFAQPAYSDRQRRYARGGSISTVYTPGFVLNGEEWRQWFSRPELDPEAGRIVGKLQVELVDGVATVRFEPARPVAANLELNLAVLGFDLTTEVGAGENRGRTLSHDFVVLAFESSAMERTGPVHRSALELPRGHIPAATRAVAAWVTERGNPRPLQATGGWLEAAR